MKSYVLITLVLVVLSTTIDGQQNDKNYRKEVLESAIGNWNVINDTMVFHLHLEKCIKIYSKDTVDGLKGTYKCIIRSKDGKINSTSEGTKIEADNAYTDYVNYPNNISMYFFDELMKKSTTGSIRVAGDTLFWMIRPNIDTYTLTVFGQDLSGPVYPKGWSVPVKAVLFRVKEEGKE